MKTSRSWTAAAACAAGAVAAFWAARAVGSSQPEGSGRSMSGVWHIRSERSPGTLVLNRDGGFALVEERKDREPRLVIGVWRVDQTDLLLESQKPTNPERPLPGRGQRIDETRWRLVADGVDTLVLIDPAGVPVVLERPAR